MHKLLTKLPVIATSGCHNYAMITDRQKFTTKWPSTWCIVSTFTTRINSSLSPGQYVLHKKVPTQIFGNVRCLILCIKTNSTPQCWCCLATDIRKKSRLNWKLKISNTADNADITQSQARDTRFCRMQEVNSLCTDSRPLWTNAVLCAVSIIQPSSFCNCHLQFFTSYKAPATAGATSQHWLRPRDLFIANNHRLQSANVGDINAQGLWGPKVDCIGPSKVSYCIQQ